ncbi:hypothetical protein EYV94_27590, partial [Puteibacter caeruleilacunae]
MFNANFRAMKRTILFLLLSCMAIGLMAAGKMAANTMTAGKMAANTMAATAAGNNINLTPKLKKGDQWKMVLQANGRKANSVYFYGDYTAKVDPNYAEWHITCLDPSSNSLTFKFTLLRLLIEDRKESAVFYDDSDYPVSLAPKDKKQVKDLLGRSITLKWDPESKDSKVVKNEFEGIQMDLPKIKIAYGDATPSKTINYHHNRSGLIGANALKIYLNAWLTIAQKGSYAIDKQYPEDIHLHHDVYRHLNIKVSDIDKQLIHVDLSGKQAYLKGEVIISKSSRIPMFMNFQGGYLNCISYDVRNEPNTTITGIIKKDYTLPVIFEQLYPVAQKEVKLDITKDQFILNLDLREPIYGRIHYNGWKIPIFIQPGNKVTIDFSVGNKMPNIAGIGADDLKTFWKYNKMSVHPNINVAGWDKSKIETHVADYINKVNQLLDENEGLITQTCKDFIKTDMHYAIGLFYASRVNESRIIQEHPDFYSDQSDAIEHADENEAYFLNKLIEYNPLSVIDISSPKYHQYLAQYLSIKKDDFLEKMGRHNDTDNPQEYILFASLAYVGYPFYYSDYNMLQSKIISGNLEQIKPQLEDFKSLPCNSAMAEKLDTLISRMEIINLHQQFPFQSIVNSDNKNSKIPKGKFCIIDFAEEYTSSPSAQNRELKLLTKILEEEKRIKSFDYVVIRPFKAKGKLQETPSNDKVKFHYIYLKEHDETYFNKVMLRSYWRRIFVVDPTQQILINNLIMLDRNEQFLLERTFEEYFDSLNQPTSQADNSRLWLIIVGSFLGFGLLSWLIIRIRSRQIARKEAARRKLTEMELKAIRSQMNPHFIFNAMGSIQNLINHNEIKNANLYLSRFARLMRMVLANSNKQLVTLADELELIQHYLELEQLRVDFQFSISCSDDIDPETEEIPGMLIQPLVENAVVHGLTPKGSGNVDVKFHKEHTNIICEIIDDGVGIGTHVGIGDDAGYEAVVGADAGTGTI